MICIDLPNTGTGQRPDWWLNFIADITPPKERPDKGEYRQELLNYVAWLNDINAKLAPYGGVFRRREKENGHYITFRVDAHYTMFIVRWT